MVGFLGDLRITPKEGISPLPPGYCPDSTAAPAEVSGKGNLSANAEAGSQLTGETTAESTQAKLMTGKEKMAADMQAAKERMAATKKTMLTF
ncbi:Uncharacterised protein [uncultured archaeon]|nr:Uncharacterised protein [uncultured archaeon]